MVHKGGIETPSLEHLIESEDLGVEVLHPGGLPLTAELARLCGIRRGCQVLEIACGTGETACLLAGEFGARVTGVDASAHMLLRARSKAESREIPAAWVRADAHALPFSDSTFDAIVCECTLCHLDKLAALREMLRVARPGGAVGIHDLCWQANSPEKMKRRLKELEEEEPETREGWLRLFEEAGLVGVEPHDRSDLMRGWTRDTRTQLGMLGYLGAALKVIRRWGFGGLGRILAAERIFASPHLGYVVIVGRRILHASGPRTERG